MKLILESNNSAQLESVKTYLSWHKSCIEYLYKTFFLLKCHRAHYQWYNPAYWLSSDSLLSQNYLVNWKTIPLYTFEAYNFQNMSEDATVLVFKIPVP